MNTLPMEVYKEGAGSGRLPMNPFHVESPTFCAVRASFPGKKAWPVATLLAKQGQVTFPSEHGPGARYWGWPLVRASLYPHNP